MKKVATHNKIFHADEVTAIALLELFTEDSYEVFRIDHETNDFEAYDLVIDIGKHFDGIKYFDHHQYKGGKSSAGLIWDYIGLNLEYPKISKLIDMIDRHDTGVERANEFEYSSLMKAFNTANITSAKQDEHFHKAVEFAKTVIGSMKKNQEDLEDAKDIVKNSYLFDGNPKILELQEFNPHWSSYINANETPHIKAVVWEDEQNWNAKIVPKYPNSFELSHKAFKPDPAMTFVHSSGHFAVAKDEETMKEFLRKHIK